MNLGENIYRLRTEKNMSQGDLADALEVSRQSVSKWENNSAVPELDKLVKMGALFGVTLDSLISGQTPQTTTQSQQEIPTALVEPTPQSSGITAGIVLLCCALLVSLFTGISGCIFLGIPLAVCGILCLCLKRRRGLWCCWVLLFTITVWLNGSVTFQPFWQALLGLALPWSYPTSLYQLLIVIALNALAALLSIFTVRSYLCSAIRFTRKRKTHLLLGWILTTPPYIGKTVVSTLPIYLHNFNQYSWPDFAYTFLTLLLTWIHLAALLTMLIFTIAKFRAGKNV